jgi:hypothetical protein
MNEVILLASNLLGLARSRLLLSVISAWLKRIDEWVALWSDWLLR